MEDNPITSLVRKSLSDEMYQEAKALAGGLPFPGQGGGMSNYPIYSSWNSWDSAMDQRFAGTKGRNFLDYANKIGDLSTNSLLVAAIRWLGNAIQEAPLVVKENEEGGKGESKPVDKHPLVKLWNKPNDYYSGSTLRKAIAFSWIMNENAYIIKNFNEAGTEPLELWWEPHWTIRPVWPQDGSEFISYYEVNRNGTWIGPIPVENVIHLRDGLNPYNQREGFSGLPSVFPELYADGEAAGYYASLLGGSAVPPFLISIDKDMRMNQLEMDQFTEEIINKTTGKRKGEPIVSKGSKVYKLAHTPKELDLRESRYMAEDRFCAVMGIPAVVLELGSGQAHSIYNNVKQAEERAWDAYISPMLKQIQEELTVQLLRDWDDPETTNRYCEHDKSKVQALQEDEDKKATRLCLLYEAGGIMRNELRSGMGYGSSDGSKDGDIDKVFAIMAAPEKAAADALAAEKAAAIEAEKTKQLGAAGITPIGGGKPKLIGAGKQKPKGAAVEMVKALLATTNDTGIEWSDFPIGYGSLGIERSAMPQVLSKHRGAMVSFLKGRGITATKEEVLPQSLKPSQKDYAPSKVEKAREWTGPQRPLLVSSDDYVADGHHQWMASLDAMEEIPIYRLGSKIMELLLEIARFPSSGVALMKALADEDVLEELLPDSEAIRERIENGTGIGL